MLRNRAAPLQHVSWVEHNRVETGNRIEDRGENPLFTRELIGERARKGRKRDRESSNKNTNRKKNLIRRDAIWNEIHNEHTLTNGR